MGVPGFPGINGIPVSKITWPPNVGFDLQHSHTDLKTDHWIRFVDMEHWLHCSLTALR